MLRAALTFFVLGLVTIILGANGVGGLSIDIGKILLLVFIILSIISLIGNILVKKRLVNPLE